MAASSSVRNMSGVFSQYGLSSEMNTAMPRAIGVAISSASADENSVPQMNGSAPNSPATGSQVRFVQNANPNLTIERTDWRVSSKPIATTMTMTTAAIAPATTRNARSPDELPNLGTGVSARLDPAERLL